VKSFVQSPKDKITINRTARLNMQCNTNDNSRDNTMRRKNTQSHEPEKLAKKYQKTSDNR